MEGFRHLVKMKISDSKGHLHRSQNAGETLATAAYTSHMTLCLHFFPAMSVWRCGTQTASPAETAPCVLVWIRHCSRSVVCQHFPGASKTSQIPAQTIPMHDVPHCGISVLLFRCVGCFQSALIISNLCAAVSVYLWQFYIYMYIYVYVHILYITFMYLLCVECV